MKKQKINTTVHTMLADVHTPVGIYLRLRDRFRDTILLESTDHHTAENSYSFICINAIAGIEVNDKGAVETKFPLQEMKRSEIKPGSELSQLLWNFVQSFQFTSADLKARFAQGVFGYSSFNASRFVEKLPVNSSPSEIPMIRYRMYQYVIAINHHRDELILCENHIEQLESELPELLTLIRNRDIPQFPFKSAGDETSPLTNDDFVEMVKKGIKSCMRGDVFQIVLSRRFEQPFTGDEFNVYRALRHVNPSPYLFYFDYGNYRLMGSSPESQLIIDGGKAIVHPIAGTFKRTGDDAEDRERAVELEKDPKENAEHVMLVDLARNDLSRVCTDVKVSRFKEIKYYSHVIHMVSEVSGQLPVDANPFEVLYKSFPAGTLSGAPKYRALELIQEYENSDRGYYGGTLGFIGANGDCNHAIMIRSLLSSNNKLRMQAGAGIVAASNPQSELEEVNNKLKALKQAIAMAETIN